MSFYHALYGKGGDTPVPPSGNTYGEVQTLLWTNSNTSTAFSAQKVTIDLSNYDGVIIEFKTISGELISTVKLSKTESINNFGAGNTSSANSESRNIASIDNTGVTFSVGYLNNSADATRVIPNKIYGYKKYESENISGTTQMSFQQNVEFDIGIGNYCIATIVGLSDVDVTPSVGEVVCSSKQVEASTYFFTQLIKSDNGKVKMPYRGVYNIVVAGA